MTLLRSFDIAAQGLNTHSRRVMVHTSNIANLATPNYQRRIPVLEETKPSTDMASLFAQARMGVSSLAPPGDTFTPRGVALSGVVLDTTPGKKMYDPNHPAADAKGYVTLSNANPMADTADAMMSSRLYEAVLSVMSIVKAMANKAIEIGR
ncbi:MAG: flagellar basal body rod protein FlgC [Vampirovibrionales bacterium]